MPPSNQPLLAAYLCDVKACALECVRCRDFHELCEIRQVLRPFNLPLDLPTVPPTSLRATSTRPQPQVEHRSPVSS